jgi:hypothetical protein
MPIQLVEEDLFELGPYRLICGDGNDPDVVQRSVQTDVARLVFTDLAFDTAFPEHKTVSAQQELAVASEAITDPLFRTFNPAWMAAFLPHLIEGRVDRRLYGLAGPAGCLGRHNHSRAALRGKTQPR